jgi:hypothetical protein
MTRSEILVEIDAMIFARLFGRDRWLADRETSLMLNKRLGQLGLCEPDPADKKTLRITPLGRELCFDLLWCFLGMGHVCEIPIALEDCGQIDDLECEAILDALGAGRDPETVLKKYVSRAYFSDYKRTELLN